MQEFLFSYRHELIGTVITFGLLIILKFITDKTIRKIGRISDIVEARTLLITKYASTLWTVIGFGVISFIWGVNFREVGLVFSSVFAVIGVALFASWSILSNITAGVILFFSFPFKIGDRVKIMDKDMEIEEPFLIEDIRAFHVSLRKKNGELLIYPNNLMMQKAVTLIYNSEDDPDGSEEA
ncbi:mechanosensitive ion channel family protein [Zobellia galactanivorans]|uniref:Small-conductance mechanosensitive channel n=1 Tax=Zobellia galactanivorans (strain DSM 12802 / CCUG 47099 / CIP 106680 / NCIMB 13871 / Dsij) TaxID=63186 RepID=G0L2F8_ZOBGA|nr:MULTISPECIES: mechanosensitive ion channel family protein [Zobellia]MBU3026304.1 mechanosensitive ion channel family protein [Zobellia galactanivorans]MDO6807701.1 mechanosensitive ion channel family protein [Zobellia galactanivorans]OWW25511.1 mechanosensitive ion channel protein MscS [Zobellia sp. OII3]CAZ98116.1 Small-conductance mechanosensitive channel [Zobellia galactanivorans]